MIKKFGLAVLIAAIAVVAFVACGGAGSDPYARFLTHYDNMIKILKENKANPERAGELLTQYQEKNEAELDKLADEIESLAEKDPMKALQYGAQLMSKTQELIELTQEMGVSF